MDRQCGFTLMELIITLAIAAIVLAIGVPSFQGMMRNNRAAAYTNEFVGALNLARSEAIKRGQRVALVPVSVGDWGQGWTVFVDVNDNGSFDDGAANVLRVRESLDGATQLVAAAPLDDYISFAPDGSARRAGTTVLLPQPATLTLSLCHGNGGNEQNSIAINPVGRAQVNIATSTIPCTH